MVDTLTKFNHIKDNDVKNFLSIEGKMEKAKQFLEVINMMDLGDDMKLNQIYTKYFDERQMDHEGMVAFKLGFKSKMEHDYSDKIFQMIND